MAPSGQHAVAIWAMFLEPGTVGGPEYREIYSLTITASRLPEGKFSVRSGTSSIDTIILADQVLELRMRGQQIHALRKSKATDPYTRLEDLAKQVPADDI